MVKAELGGDDKEVDEIDEDDFANLDREGVGDFANVYTYKLWYQMGGQERGMSFPEMKELTGAEMKDLLYLSGRHSKIRRVEKKRKENEEDWGKKKSKAGKGAMYEDD